MRVLTGQVQGGRIITEAELPEGMAVTVVMADAEEHFALDAEQEDALLAAIDEVERGELVSAEAALAELRNL